MLINKHGYMIRTLALASEVHGNMWETQDPHHLASKMFVYMSQCKQKNPILFSKKRPTFLKRAVRMDTGNRPPPMYCRGWDRL